MDMSSHHESVDRNQPLYYCSSSNTTRSSTLTSPYIEFDASSTRPKLQLPSDNEKAGPNLFASLLLNREEVYSDCSAASPDHKPVLRNLLYASTRNSDSPLQSVETDAKPYIPPEDLDVDLLLNELLSMAPVVKTVKKRGRPTRQAAEVKQKSLSTKTRKRASPISRMTKDAKRRKTEANSSRKLDPQEQSQGDSNETMVKADTSEEVEIIEISDGEYEEPKLPPQHSLAARLEQSPLKTCDHTQEVQRLREEVAAAKAETVAAKAAAETARAETNTTQTLLGTKDEYIKVSDTCNCEQATTLGSIKFTLEALQANLSDVTRERDQYQAHSRELKDTQSRLQALQQKFDLAEKEHAEVVHNLTERLFSTDAMQSPQSSQDTPSSSFSSTFQQYTKPATPPATPTFATPLDSHAAPSASPFRSTTSVDEQKTEGVRRTYVKIKRKYDNLHSVLINLEICTRSMDLSSFGEFGRIMKQIRIALEEDGREQ